MSRAKGSGCHRRETDRPAAAQDVFAARQGLSHEVTGYAHALRTEALAGLGELLKKAPKRAGARGQKG